MLRIVRQSYTHTHTHFISIPTLRNKPVNTFANFMYVDTLVIKFSLVSVDNHLYPRCIIEGTITEYCIYV